MIGNPNPPVPVFQTTRRIPVVSVARGGAVQAATRAGASGRWVTGGPVMFGSKQFHGPFPVEPLINCPNLACVVSVRSKRSCSAMPDTC